MNILVAGWDSGWGMKVAQTVVRGTIAREGQNLLGG